MNADLERDLTLYGTLSVYIPINVQIRHHVRGEPERVHAKPLAVFRRTVNRAERGRVLADFLKLNPELHKLVVEVKFQAEPESVEIPDFRPVKVATASD